jgi:hypothetical protein
LVSVTTGCSNLDDKYLYNLLKNNSKLNAIFNGLRLKVRSLISIDMDIHISGVAKEISLMKSHEMI